MKERKRCAQWERDMGEGDREMEKDTGRANRLGERCRDTLGRDGEIGRERYAQRKTCRDKVGGETRGDAGPEKGQGERLVSLGSLMPWPFASLGSMVSELPGAPPHCLVPVKGQSPPWEEPGGDTSPPRPLCLFTHSFKSFVF